MPVLELVPEMAPMDNLGRLSMVQVPLAVSVLPVPGRRLVSILLKPANQTLAEYRHSGYLVLAVGSVAMAADHQGHQQSVPPRSANQQLLDLNNLRLYPSRLGIHRLVQIVLFAQLSRAADKLVVGQALLRALLSRRLLTRQWEALPVAADFHKVLPEYWQHLPVDVVD